MATYSAVLIIPAEHLEPINALGALMGWGYNYRVALAALDGDATPTHDACRADVTDGFLDMVGQAATTGEVDGVTLTRSMRAALAELVIHIHPDPTLAPEDQETYRTPKAQFEAVIASQGLQKAVA